jgi:hypothetical protein
MAICWYCHWGWPAVVREIHDRYAAMCIHGADGLHYGPSHVVWDDENFTDHTIIGCIEGAAEHHQEFIGTDTDFGALAGRGESEEFWNPVQDFLMAVMSLLELLQVPEAIRCCEPEDYDLERPENYPPPPNLDCQRV